MIRIISFDVWGTLVAAPPELPQLLVGYFAARTAKDPAEISRCITSMGQEFDRAAVRSGRDIASREKLLRLAHALGVENPCGNELEREVRRHIEQAPPYLIEPASFAAVWTYIQRCGIEVVFASNSGFVGGETMRTVLERLGVLSNHHRCIFSDEVGRAKPSIRFFQTVATAWHDPSTILHIGDNFEADYLGARAAGMAALQYVRNGTITNAATQIRSISALPDVISSAEVSGHEN